MKNIKEEKILYVSDLDGTLFNSNKAISEYSINIINKFIKKGGLFTIATARTSYGCDYRLDNINFNIPAILMNGVYLYSFKDKKFNNVKLIDNNKISEIEKVLDNNKISGFMYTYNNNKISIFYKNTEDIKYTQYYSDRAKQECNEISFVENFSNAAENKNVIYFAMTGIEKNIFNIYKDIKDIPGIGYAYYLNIYNGLYCLELFNNNASKSIAILELKNMIKVSKVIVFGDNHNDIDMIKIADKSYAPENAVQKIKNIVDGIIESNDNDGVAKFFSDRYNL